MSSPAHSARLEIEGQEAAESAIRALGRAEAPPHLLYDRLHAIVVLRQPEKLRAFCATLQKLLERGD